MRARSLSARLIGLRGRDPARQQLRLAVEFAVLELLQRAQIVQRRQRFLVVETREKIAAFERSCPRSGSVR